MELVRRALLWSSHNRWLAERLPRWRPVRHAVRRFLPGEELDDALREAERLAGLDIETVVTLLGEDVPDAAATHEVVEHYRGAYCAIGRRGLPAEVSVKPTHLGLLLGRDLAEENLETLAAEAEARGNFLWIDMESSAHVDATLEIFQRLCRRHRRVGLCLQSYLKRTAGDLEALLPAAPAIRLVKGAYDEPADLAFADKGRVDQEYFDLAVRMLRPEALAAGLRPAFATHDPELIERIRRAADEAGAAPDRYEIQMLFGIRREAQLELARRGHRVRVLVSYGPAWFAWYMRRLAERPANLGFLVRSFFAS